MADKTLSVSATSSHSARSTAQSDIELIVVLRPRSVGLAEFQGSRADIQAERVVPQDLRWPSGADVESWTTGGLRFTLHRMRPKGFKGARKLWIQGDWWCLRWQAIDRPSFGELEIARRAADLAEAFVRFSPAGEARAREHLHRYMAALEDQRFEAFKALVMGFRR